MTQPASARPSAPFHTAPTLRPNVGHPSLQLLITEPQRDRALTYLQSAYADGRLTAEELDVRVGQALMARNRAELNKAFAGLVTVPLATAAVGSHPAYAPMLNQHRDGVTGRGAAGLAHFSALGLGFLGPALVYAATSPGTFAHREAAKAFNTQVGLSALLAASIGLAVVAEFGFGVFVVGVLWFVLTIVGGAKAASGEDSGNVLTRLNPVKLLDERQGRRELSR